MQSNAGMGSIVIVAATLGLASCSQLSPADSERATEERWSQVRSRLKYQLAADSFAAGQLDEAQQHLEESIGLAPEEPAVYVLLARLRLERGETASAAEALDQAVRLGGDSAELDYLHGLIAQRYARFSDAQAWYQRASERDPSNAHYVAAVAEMLVALDRVAEALALVRARWTDFEQSVSLRGLAGEIYMMLGRYAEAAGAYREAYQMAPDDELLTFQLGLALTFSGSYQEGRAVLVSATGAAADVPATILLARGRCHLALSEYEEAKAVIRRAVDADPDNVRGWTWLAQAALCCDDLLTARRAATRAVQLDPENSDHGLLLGYVCWRGRDFPAAVRWLERVLREAPDEAAALCLLGQCHEAMGDGGAARDSYRRALRANPDCDWARGLLERGPVPARLGRDRRPLPDNRDRSP